MATAKAFNEARELLLELQDCRFTRLYATVVLKNKLSAWLDANPAADTTVDAETEQTFSYLHATGIIESSCASANPVTEDHLVWYDLDDVDELAIDVTEESEYLDSRRLLWHHPENPRWVNILDEAEPLPPPAEKAGA